MLTTTPTKSAGSVPVNKVSARLIDPFKCEVFPIVVDWEDQADIHKLLDADLLQSLPMNGFNILWVDECGLLREPFIYPQFKIPGVNGNCPLTGYGLVTGCRNAKVTNYVMGMDTCVIWEEHWPRRINPDQCIDQLLRVYFQPKP